MLIGELYRCQNAGCRCEIRVVKASVEATLNPRCVCGAEMKKHYTKPIFRQMDDTAIEFFSTPDTVRKRQN